MGTLVVRRFSTVVPVDVPVLLLVASFVMYLASEKIEGRVIPVQEKAFCYFGSYTLLFVDVGRYAWRMLASKTIAAWVSLALFIMVVPVVVYQAHHFKLRAKEVSASRWVLFLGVLAIAGMSSIPIRFLKKAFCF